MTVNKFPAWPLFATVTFAVVLVSCSDGEHASVAGVGGHDAHDASIAPDASTARDGGASMPAGALVWREANLTNYESYPDPGSDECTMFNGCALAGMFAALDGVQSKEWVMSHNIAAVHMKDFHDYERKTLRLRQTDHMIDVVVYDMCADADCDGCCTTNAQQNHLDFLIDIERYTMERFGTGDGIVQWACVDCEQAR